MVVWFVQMWLPDFRACIILHHVSDIEIRPGLPSFDGLRTAPRMGHWGSHCVGLAKWQDVTGEVEWMSEMHHHWRARLAASTRSMLPTCRQMSALLRSWRRHHQTKAEKTSKIETQRIPKQSEIKLHPEMPYHAWLADTWVSLFRRSIKSQTNCATSLPNVLILGVVSSCFKMSARLLLPSLKSGCSSPTAWPLGGKGKCPREQQCTQSKLDFLGRGTSSTAALHVDCWDWASSQGFVLIGMWQLLWRYINAVTRCGRQQQWCIDVSRRSCNFPESFA